MVEVDHRKLEATMKIVVVIFIATAAVILGWALHAGLARHVSAMNRRDRAVSDRLAAESSKKSGGAM
jgi:hypothetical protein